MDYNKFIYKINKYKSYQRNSDKKRKEHYNKKIDFYYKQLEKIINMKGGTFTNADLLNFLEPTTKTLEEELTKKADIALFENEEKKYIENHKKIIEHLRTIDETHNKELNNKLQQIRKTVDEQKEKKIIL